jgi:hypothetical protein
LEKTLPKQYPELRKLSELVEIYGNVALTGKKRHFEIHFEPLDIGLSISAYCPKKGFFAAVFKNIT